MARVCDASYETHAPVVPVNLWYPRVSDPSFPPGWETRRLRIPFSHETDASLRLAPNRGDKPVTRSTSWATRPTCLRRLRRLGSGGLLAVTRKGVETASLIPAPPRGGIRVRVGA